MFDFQNANEEQREAIQTTDGPLLIIAGPGTGKTFTLVQRALYLIQEKNVDPRQILIATFTEKAAKVLVTRITDELSKRNIVVNLNEMYVGTFHSICLRILKENLTYTSLQRNFSILDQFDQQYNIFRTRYKYSHIPGFSEFIDTKNHWEQAEKICKYVNILSEEMIDPSVLKMDPDVNISTMGYILEKYYSFLSESNYLDFSTIQVETYKLFMSNPNVLKAIQDQITYIMVDEYQDTNHIQEQIIFKIAGEKNNICMVGDDDQGLYRFRGATIRNILEFPTRFPKGACKEIHLTVNYRSSPEIVDFYNRWMKETSGSRFKFSWEGKFRFDKDIQAHNPAVLDTPTVIRVSGKDEEEETWHAEILHFIHTLEKSGSLTNYNQIAFLFRSVKNAKVIRLADFLEKNGIHVYSPRSEMFFQREEIMCAIGCLLLVFPDALGFLKPDEGKYVFKDLIDYYNACVQTALNFAKKDEHLMSWIHDTGIYHSNLKENTDYNFAGLYYKLLAQKPFSDLLMSDLTGNAVDLRPQRNLALLSQVLSKYDYLHKVNVLTMDDIEKQVEALFNLYLRLLIDEGIPEYENQIEYAPNGCVSFLTIHQAKGMEFPVVIVGVENSNPRNSNDDFIVEIERRYFDKKPFEPYNQIKFFDFWRLYYTAYSRAQNLLVLTSRERDGRGIQPSMYFRDVFEKLPEYTDEVVDLASLNLAEVKDVRVKQTYSFTSHILLYENCNLQYKYYKELEFTPSRKGSTIFGTIVHQTIEDVHKAAMKGDAETITNDNVEMWLRLNYNTMIRRENSYLSERQIQYAIEHVQGYVDKERDLHKGDWSHIVDSEVDVSLVKENYILEGTIDLIRGLGDRVDLVDFKAEKKPDLFDRKSTQKIERYKKQLQIYAHLVEERTGNKVGKLRIYYTGTQSGNPELTFKKDDLEINETIKEFDDVVEKIQTKNYADMSESSQQCRACDFRHFCRKEE